MELGSNLCCFVLCFPYSVLTGLTQVLRDFVHLNLARHLRLLDGIENDETLLL